MSRLPSLIVGLVVIAAGVVKWRAYEKPNALQLAALHAGLIALMALWAWDKLRRRNALDSQERSAAGWRAWAAPEALLAAYAALCAASILWAPLPWIAGIGASCVLPCVLWALLIADMLRSPDARLRAITLIAVAIGVLAACSLWDLGMGMDLRQRQGHPNMLASFVLGASFAGVGALGAWSSRKNLGRARFAVVAPLGAMLVAGALLLAHTRSMGAWIGMAAGAALFALAFCPRRLRRRLLIAVAVALLVALLVLPRFSSALAPFSRRLFRSQQATRLFHLQGCLDMLAQRPVLGWGAGSFMGRFSDFKTPEAVLHGWGGSITIHPHNEFALIAVETGAVGLALYALALAACALRAFRAADDGGPDRWVVAASLAGAFAMLVHGCVSVALRYWGPMAMYWSMLGMALASSRRPAPAARLSKGRRQAMAALACGAAVIMAVTITVPGQRAHYYMGLALDMRHLPDKRGTRLRLYAAAQRLSRYAPQYIYAMMWPAQLLTTPETRDRAIDAFEKLESVAPGFGAARMLHGRLRQTRFERMGHKGKDGKRALDLLTRFARQRPDLPKARRYQVEALMTLSPRNAAMCARKMRVTTALHPDNAAAHGRLAQCLAFQGRFRDAERCYGRAIGPLLNECGDARRRDAQMKFLAPGFGDPKTAGRAEAARYRLASAYLTWARMAATLKSASRCRQRLALAQPFLHGFPDLIKRAQSIEKALARPE